MKANCLLMSSSSIDINYEFIIIMNLTCVNLFCHFNLPTSYSLNMLFLYMLDYFVSVENITTIISVEKYCYYNSVEFS